MFRVVECYRQSGLTQKRFCETEGLALSTLQFWVSRYKQHQSAPENSRPFVELKAQSPALAEDDTIVLRYPNGVTLSLSGAIDLVNLKELITLPTT
jgi:transposase-like protein